MRQSPHGIVSVSEILAYLNQDRYLSLSETCRYISLSERTIRERLSEIPHFRLGSKLLFRKSEMDKWLLKYRESLEDFDIDPIVDEVVESVLPELCMKMLGCCFGYPRASAFLNLI